MVNVVRGFRRVAWFLVAASLPVVGFFAYEGSSRQTGYESRLITSDFPSPDNTYDGKTAVEVSDVGFIYFPPSFSKAEIEPFLKRHFARATNATPLRPGAATIKAFASTVRSKYPEYRDLSDTELTKRVLTKYPIYRDDVNFKEFEVVPKYAKRPAWALAVTLVICGGLLIAFHALISAVTWVVYGFKAV